MAPPLSHPRIVRAAVVVLLVGLVTSLAVEAGHDDGEVVEARIVGERLAGQRVYYAVEMGADRGEFVVMPIAGLCHGYPVVGERTEVRRRDGALRWNAWGARYPVTAVLGLVALSTAGALALRRARAAIA